MQRQFLTFISLRRKHAATRLTTRSSNAVKLAVNQPTVLLHYLYLYFQPDWAASVASAARPRDLTASPDVFNGHYFLL